ncbi:MAG TPA: glycosyltransferase family 2 protein [Pyrinomonadaceae bacterium]|jgi:glycosyltransferase involved in cell wall biosynthesis|nr:glycosyltransferase family 2 protein [Pyrinomonadaceae bacterium]
MHVAFGNPLVSIGLPVYNGERDLPRAIDSLLAQDYYNFEIVISDNASTDNTRRICEEYAARDARIKLSFNNTNIGIIANFESVLEKASGKYFMWAAHDDFWSRSFVGSMVEELEGHSEASVAMSAVQRLHENGSAHDVVRFEGAKNPNSMTPFQLAMALAHGSPHHLFIYGLFRRDFLRRAFKNFPRVIASDRLLMIQIAMSTRFRYADQVLHTRLINDEPIAVRYKGEQFGRVWHDRNAHLKKALATGPYLLQSQIIPWQRKFWIPIIVIWPPLRRLYYRIHRFFYWLASRLLGQGGRRKRIVNYLKRLGDMNSR